MPDIIPSASAGEPRPVAEETHPAPCWFPYYPECTCRWEPPRNVAPIPVPIPDSVAALIGSCMPLHVLQAEIDVDAAAREFGRFHTPLGTAQFDSEDQADREQTLSRIAVANKVLAAYNPRLVLRPVRAS